MPTYHSQLRPASYRGIAFEVPDDESVFGQRHARHEFPGRDGAAHEPLGLKAQSFRITAIVAGADFMARANALEAALKTPQAGLLLHPYYGERLVVAIDPRRQHSATDVGLVRFDIEFEEYDAPQYPSAARDTAAALNTASAGLFSAIEETFNARFKWTAIPDFLAADALGRINGFMGGFNELLSGRGVRALVGDLPRWTGLDGGLASNVTGFFKTIAGLARPSARPMIGRQPAALSDTQRREIIGALSAAGDISSAAAGTSTTATSSRRANNAAALDGLFRGSALAATGAAARYMTYESREDAIRFRNATATRLERLSDDYGRAGWDDAWHRAGLMKAALTRDINERIGRLPRTLKVRTQAVRPSMALANRLYGDDPAALFERAEDIVRRNRVRHPGFVPADELEVLIDAGV